MPQTIDFNALYLVIKDDLVKLGVGASQEAIECLQQSILNAQQRMNGLAEGWKSGQLVQDFITRQLADEKNIFQTELLSYEVFGLAKVQDARDQTIYTIATTVIGILVQALVKAA